MHTERSGAIPWRGRDGGLASVRRGRIAAFGAVRSTWRAHAARYRCSANSGGPGWLDVRRPRGCGIEDYPSIGPGQLASSFWLILTDRASGASMSVPPPRITAMRFAAPNDPSVLRDGMDRNMATVAAASTECLRSIAAYDKRK